MRRTIGISLAFLLPLMASPATRADDLAKGILGKAIKASGGEEKLTKHKAVTFKETGTYYGMGDGLPYQGKYAVQFPDKFKMEIEGVFTIVLNGDKGWVSTGGDVKEMTKEQVDEQKAEHHAAYVTSLIPLQDKEYVLSSLGEVKVGDKPAVGLKVSRKGYRDVELYFDKDANLLIKAKWMAKAQEQGGKEVTQEAFYTDHKNVDGAMVPMKMVVNRDGKKYVEAEVKDYKAEGKLADGVFGKP